jgi:hypothetical protein
MKRKPSISHDEAMAKELRENPEFAVEYLRAALEEGDDGGSLGGFAISDHRSLSSRTAESRSDVGFANFGAAKESRYQWRPRGLV